MTRDERTASSIAVQLCAALNRYESFMSDPEMVWEEIERQMRLPIPTATCKTVGDVLAVLKGNYDRQI